MKLKWYKVHCAKCGKFHMKILEGNTTLFMLFCHRCKTKTFIMVEDDVLYVKYDDVFEPDSESDREELDHIFDKKLMKRINLS